MCGLAGIVGIHRADFKKKLSAMLDTIGHRGPDGRGFHCADGVNLGHVRLSILDVRASANQPIYNEDRSLCVIHNGEIYNYIELRQQLLRRGHRFRTESDSEVIVHAYEEYGHDCVNEFNGMWAFAIWDEHKGELFLSRDRLGIKQLYYASVDGAFVFASEIKALIQSFPCLKEVNRRQIRDFLVAGLTDHGQSTFFRDISQLLPSQNLVLTRSGEISKSRYWSINTDQPFVGTIEQAASELRELFCDAVRLQMRSDVPVCATLSGGLDSTTVVAFASKLASGGLLTFSGLYPDDSRYDESVYVQAMADRFDLAVVPISPKPDHILDDLAKCMWHLDEPVTSQSIYTWWHINRRIGSDFKVVLTGHGGDEVQAGYFHHYRFFHMHLLEQHVGGGGRSVPDDLRREWALAKRLNGTDYLPQVLASSTSPSVRRLGERWQRMLKHKSTVPNNPGLRRAFDKDFMSESEDSCLTTEEHVPGLDVLRKFMWRELRSAYLPSILRIEDRISMAHSLEARVPLLDHRIVEFAYSLPSAYLIREGRTKYVVRQAMRGILPESVRLRADKMGFPTPVATWLRGEFGKEVEALITSSQARSRWLFNQNEVKRQMQFHRSGKGDLSKRIFMWLMCELWLRNVQG